MEIYFLCIIIIFKILLIILLFCFITKKIFHIINKSLNYCKQNPYNVSSQILDSYGKLLASFYTYYSYRPFIKSIRIFNILFSKRYRPVQVDIYEKIVIVRGKELYLIDKNEPIFLKCLPVLNTEAGMVDFYNEYITFPALYRNYFDKIYVTDILGKDKFSKLLLTPSLANCLKENLKFTEKVEEELQAPPINY